MKARLWLPILLLPVQGKPGAKPPVTTRPGPVESSAAFLARLQEALVRRNAPKKLKGFIAKTRLTIRDPKANVDLEAKISFRSPSRLRTLIREGKKTILRVYDRGRPWMQTSQGAYYLQGKEYARDRRDLRRDLSLASLVLRFLRPVEELKKLRGLKGPKKVELRFGRKGRFKALVLEGVAPKELRYPLGMSPKHRGEVWVRAFFEEGSLKPLQVEMAPLDGKTGKRVGKVERYRFHGHALKEGLLLPTALSVLVEGEGGKMRVVEKVQILEFALNPELPGELFRKP
ncbi:MAG TPA: hypothetical protein ENK02_09560 [Planctomycetes bacterium]|nr:hypothetical protein [Planctomycetota bacterium]